jgi:hypothetical protein
MPCFLWILKPVYITCIRQFFCALVLIVHFYVVILIFTLTAILTFSFLYIGIIVAIVSLYTGCNSFVCVWYVGAVIYYYLVLLY